MSRKLLWRTGVALLISIGVLSTAGCRRAGRLDEKERGNRIVVKAYEMVDQGDFAAAVALFNKALEAYPGMARPHLDLAMLLHDRQNDYMRAIYHYHRYLDQRPDTEKVKMIRQRIQQAERAFVLQRLTAEGMDGRSVQDLLDKNRALRKQLEDAQRSASELKVELSMLRDADRKRLRADVAGVDHGASAAAEPVVPPAPEIPDQSPPEDRYPIRMVETPPPPAAATATPVPLLETVPRPVAEPPPREPEMRESSAEVAARPKSDSTMRPDASSDAGRTYTVQRGDSLSRIAYKIYGDAERWRIIHDANREVLKDSMNVRIGQTLIIP